MLIGSHDAGQNPQQLERAAADDLEAVELDGQVEGAREETCEGEGAPLTTSNAGHCA